jgi:hypothetical protein
MAKDVASVLEKEKDVEPHEIYIDGRRYWFS